MQTNQTVCTRKIKMDITQFDTIISSDKSSSSAKLKTLLSYRGLMSLLIRRNFVMLYKQSILGPLWILINPLIMSIVFTFVFGTIAQISTDEIPHIVFYLSGTTMWGLFSSIVRSTSNTFIKNKNIFSKVYFPRMTMVISTTATSLINFLIQFAMFLIFYFYYLFNDASYYFTLNFLLAPVLILQSMLFAVAVGLFVASLTVKYRDFVYILTIFLQLWMYGTPIAYPLSVTSGTTRLILLCNPVTSIVHNFRFALFSQGEFLVTPWIISWVVTLVLFFVSVKIFERREKDMIDMV